MLYQILNIVNNIHCLTDLALYKYADRGQYIIFYLFHTFHSLLFGVCGADFGTTHFKTSIHLECICFQLVFSVLEGDVHNQEEVILSRFTQNF